MSKAKLKRIHVNQHHIKANAKNNNQELPVFTVKTYDSNTVCNEVEIRGPSKMVYAPEDPLSCGARVWIETRSDVNMKLNDATEVTI